ncbi:MAG: baseplate protein, partial [Pseudomonadota bacterium]|nr:baseplate protein [Pseudomonadota bacterium]
VSDDTSTLQASMDIIVSCIDVVYNEDESWAAADCTKKELDQWLETLNTSQFKEIESFFETMPKLTHKVKVTNPNTKVESEVTLEGLQSFFG